MCSHALSDGVMHKIDSNLGAGKQCSVNNLIFIFPVSRDLGLKHPVSVSRDLGLLRSVAVRALSLTEEIARGYYPVTCNYFAESHHMRKRR